MDLYWCLIPTGDSGLTVKVTTARCCISRVYLIKDVRDLRCTGRRESEQQQQQPWFDLDLSLTEEAEQRGSDRRWCYWADGLWGCAVPLSGSRTLKCSDRAHVMSMPLVRGCSLSSPACSWDRLQPPPPPPQHHGQNSGQGKRIIIMVPETSALIVKKCLGFEPVSLSYTTQHVLFIKLWGSRVTLNLNL